MSVVRDELRKLANPERAAHSARFFKTGKGEYGEGDVFLGITNPVLRGVVRKYWKDVDVDEIRELLGSEVHDDRLAGLLILVEKFERKSEMSRADVLDVYLENLDAVNNWDLVDLSAWKIVGAWFADKDNRSVLYELARSENMWERRVAIVSTFAFIRKNDLDDALKLSEILVKDDEDLMHKAVGWMLREVGKKDVVRLEDFLRTNYDKMSRTTLRYAIEKFEENSRKKWLKRAQ